MEIIIVGAIILFVLVYNNTIDKDKFIADNQKYLEMLKEDDYQFLVYARYGEDVDVEQLFSKRVSTAFITFLVVMVFFISGNNSVDIFNSQFFLNLVLAIVVAVVVFKMPYSQLKSYYKQHLHEIDVMLPYYLKSLEILIQHYTIPVALGRSINDAPPIFREGLQELINQINAGDDTINPYMAFAKTYPVRDSMRMMRLLYRLSLGRQENKQDQLLMFSRTISNLQQKARELKYKKRLEKMESKTMQMLVTTGVGVMILLVFAVLRMMNM